MGGGKGGKGKEKEPIALPVPLRLPQEGSNQPSTLPLLPGPWLDPAGDLRPRTESLQ